MKKFLKVIGVVLILLLAALIALPMIFKDDIVKLVKEEANKSVNAKIDFGDFDLSLIKSFPDFYFSIEEIAVTGIDRFEGLELASIQELDLTVDLMSVINGESINIKKIGIVEPIIHAKVLADGSANYLIAKEDSTVVEAQEGSTEESSPFKMELQKFEIINATIIYDDITMPVHMAIESFNMVLSGDFTENITNIKTIADIAKVNLTYDGIHYVKNTEVAIDVDMAANLEEFKFTFNENEIRINELPLGFDGWIAMPSDPINMDLKFHAKETDFKELLSMIPAEFAKDLEGVKTEGVLALDGYASGTFIDSTYPAFGINLSVDNAMFHYPDLPKSVTDIQIKARVESKDGVINNTIVDVPVFHLKMANNPFDINFFLATPISDPFVRAGMKGKLVLDNIKDLVPLEDGDELAGTFNADVSIEGNLSTIEEERYEEFKAEGQIVASGIKFISDSLDYPVEVKNADLLFTPKYLSLNKMSMQLGASDIAASGKLENFIAYALKEGEVLQGELNVNSNYLDINELAGIEPSTDEEETTEESTGEEEPLEVVVLPKYIDFITIANIGKLQYDDITITDISGAIDLKNQKVAMKNTNMNLMDGSMLMNGFYETSDSLRPSYDFAMDIKKFDLKKTVETFNTVEKLAPIAKKSTGNFSAKMTILGALDSRMEPIYETMFGQGKLKTHTVSIDGYEPMQKVAKTIKYDHLDPLGINDVNISFKITEGKVYVDPFTNKIGDTKMTIAGSNSFDQTIDYIFSFAIPRKEFGSSANKALEGLLSQASSKGLDLDVAEMINIDVQLVGPANNPTIKTDLKKTASNATQALKDKAKEEFNKKKEELKKQALEEIEKKKEELEKEVRKEIDAQKKKAQEELEKQKKKAQEEIDKKKEEAKKKLEEEAKKKLKDLFK